MCSSDGRPRVTEPWCVVPLRFPLHALHERRAQAERSQLEQAYEQRLATAASAAEAAAEEHKRLMQDMAQVKDATLATTKTTHEREVRPGHQPGPPSLSPSPTPTSPQQWREGPTLAPACAPHPHPIGTHPPPLPLACDHIPTCSHWVTHPLLHCAMLCCAMLCCAVQLGRLRSLLQEERERLANALAQLDKVCHEK
jgi:hypothetical protein